MGAQESRTHREKNSGIRIYVRFYVSESWESQESSEAKGEAYWFGSIGEMEIVCIWGGIIERQILPTNIATMQIPS